MPSAQKPDRRVSDVNLAQTSLFALSLRDAGANLRSADEPDGAFDLQGESINSVLPEQASLPSVQTRPGDGNEWPEIGQILPLSHLPQGQVHPETPPAASILPLAPPVQTDPVLIDRSVTSAPDHSPILNTDPVLELPAQAKHTPVDRLSPPLEAQPDTVRTQQDPSPLVALHRVETLQTDTKNEANRPSDVVQAMQAPGRTLTEIGHSQPAGNPVQPVDPATVSPTPVGRSPSRDSDRVSSRLIVQDLVVHKAPQEILPPRGGRAADRWVQDFPVGELQRSHPQVKNLELRDLQMRDLSLRDLQVRDMQVKDLLVKDLQVKGRPIEDLHLKTSQLPGLPAKDRQLRDRLSAELIKSAPPAGRRSSAGTASVGNIANIARTNPYAQLSVPATPMTAENITRSATEGHRLSVPTTGAGLDIDLVMPDPKASEGSERSMGLVESHRPALSTASQTTTLASVRESGDVVHEQVMRAMSRQTLAQGRMTIQLNPRELGALDIEFWQERGELQVAIVAREPATRELLDTSLARLRQSLQEAGINVGDLDVRQDKRESKQDHTYRADRIPGQDRDRDDAEPNRPRRSDNSGEGLFDVYV